jgi:hypothetical protein
MHKGFWDRFLRELRKLVFGACCAIGGLAGMWTGIWRSPELDARGGLLDELWSTLKPMLAYFGGGLAIGIAIGLLICLTLLKPRARSAPEPQSPRDAPSIASRSRSAPAA